jgi:hypothetical protein
MIMVSAVRCARDAVLCARSRSRTRKTRSRWRPASAELGHDDRRDRSTRQDFQARAHPEVLWTQGGARHSRRDLGSVDVGCAGDRACCRHFSKERRCASSAPRPRALRIFTGTFSELAGIAEGHRRQDDRVFDKRLVTLAGSSPLVKRRLRPNPRRRRPARHDAGDVRAGRRRLVRRRSGCSTRRGQIRIIAGNDAKYSRARRCAC